MLKLNASYSKKIPVDGTDFSSQSYHAAVEAELPDGLTPEQLRGRIHDTFMLVRNAVESELHGVPAPAASAPATAPVAPVTPQPVAQPQYPAARQQSGRPRNGAPGANGNQPASGRQVQFLTDLALRRGMSLQQLTAHVRSRYNVADPTRLNRGQASELIDGFTDDGETRRAA